MRKFTIHAVFKEDPDVCDFYSPDLSEGHTVQEAIAAAIDEMGDLKRPTAWSIEPSAYYGGERGNDTLLAESIAAARLIECIDGKYIARIPGEVGFDFKREDEPAGSRPPYGHKPTTLGDLLRGAKAILDKLPAVAPPATDQNAAMVARDGPARPAWQPAPQPTPAPANKPQGPHAAFFALRVDVPAGHLLGQGNPDF